MSPLLGALVHAAYLGCENPVVKARSADALYPEVLATNETDMAAPNSKLAEVSLEHGYIYFILVTISMLRIVAQSWKRRVTILKIMD